MMMKIKNGNKYGHLISEDLKMFESLIKCKLPKEFRNFLLKYNGGDPDPSDFDISTEEGTTTLNGIYGLHNGPHHCNLLQNYLIYKGRIPKQLLAIGGDNLGNQICIGLTKKYTGCIYFWDHEKERKIFKFSAITLLASNFNTFIDNLYEFIDPNETKLEKIIRLEDLEGMSKLINQGFDINTYDKNQITPIELCAIHRKHVLMEYLFYKGAKIGASLTYAEENSQYFEEHKETVKLIKSLKNKL